jgi:hypothetical protein
LAVLGTLGGVVFTQVWNSRLEERRWARESERLREAQAREDLGRAYEHRRAAYVGFLEEFERVQGMFGGDDQEPLAHPLTHDPRFDTLEDRRTAVSIYGTHEAVKLANLCCVAVRDWAWRTDGDHGQVIGALGKFRARVRRDLGVPDPGPTPAEAPNSVSLDWPPPPEGTFDWPPPPEARDASSQDDPE